jgi:YopT peptidase
MPSAEQRKNCLKVCEAYAGTHIPFNQSWSEIKAQRSLSQFYNDKAQVLQDKVYIGGMCNTMSAYWLALRNQGKSFFDWLRPGGVWDKGAINVLVVKTGMYKNNMNGWVPGADNEFNDRFFANYGLTRFGYKSKGKEQVQGYLRRQTQGCHMISVGSSESGHAIAMHMDRSGASAFFDPNYGEYAFMTSDWACHFFSFFLRESTYDKKYTEFEVVSYR